MEDFKKDINNSLKEEGEEDGIEGLCLGNRERE